MAVANASNPKEISGSSGAQSGSEKESLRLVEHKNHAPPIGSSVAHYNGKQLESAQLQRTEQKSRGDKRQKQADYRQSRSLFDNRSQKPCIPSISHHLHFGREIIMAQQKGSS